MNEGINKMTRNKVKYIVIKCSRNFQDRMDKYFFVHPVGLITHLVPTHRKIGND
jgi:hypothetical protein